MALEGIATGAGVTIYSELIAIVPCNSSALVPNHGTHEIVACINIGDLSDVVVLYGRNDAGENTCHVELCRLPCFTYVPHAHLAKLPLP